MTAIVLALYSVALGGAQTKGNHLVGATSAYLKRVSGQPVDWYPWGPDAFKRAKVLNRPILLDIGAVWCSWCELMDRDTYNNAETAQLINQNFMAVKVDFDASPELVAQIERAQAVLNLPAGCRSQHSLRRRGSSISALATFPLCMELANALFELPPRRLLYCSQTNRR